MLGSGKVFHSKMTRGYPTPHLRHSLGALPEGHIGPCSAPWHSGDLDVLTGDLLLSIHRASSGTLRNIIRVDIYYSYMFKTLELYTV